MLKPGDRVERYEVVSLLGEGGMARVYRVRHTTLQTDHALKILTLTGPSLKDRLVAEGRIQADLRHPNIVRVTDVLEADGMPGLVMDFIDGSDLHTWIRTEHPDAALAEKVFRGIVAGVKAAHDAGVVHRDLKPANVLMSRDARWEWVPRVCDFGLVKAVAGDSQSWKTRSGIPMGTPTYMAPEQIRDAANVDHRADIFSLGCILYELVSFHIAYAGPDLLSIFERVQAGRRDSLPPGTPPHLNQVVDRCLQLDPDDRPADCAAVLHLLDSPVSEPVAPATPAAGATFAQPVLTAPPTDPTIPEGSSTADTLPEPSRPAVPPVQGPQPPTIGTSPARLALLAAPAVLLAGGLGVLLLGGLLMWWMVGGIDPQGPCPESGGELGYARAPMVFLKGEGATWRVRGDTPVVDAHPDGAQVCLLPSGSEVVLSEEPVKDSGTWVLVRGDALTLPDDEDEPDEEEEAAPPEEDEEAPEPAPPDPMDGPCPGRAGEVVGYANAKPFFQKQGQTWTLLSHNSVYGDFPREDNGYKAGPVVCSLEVGTAVDLVQAPIKVRGTGQWIPIVAGAIR